MGKQLSLKLLDEKIVDIKDTIENLWREVKALNIKTQERINVIENLAVTTSNEVIGKYTKPESAYPARHYQDWTEQEKGSLEAKIRLICRDRAKQHQRTKRAIAWKIREYLTSENIIKDFPEF